MKISIVVVILCVLGAVLITGCTQPQTTSPTTQVSTPVQQSTVSALSSPSAGSQVVVTQAGSARLVSGPTDDVPAPNKVLVQVDRDRVATTPTITISFRGGAGMNAVVSMDVMVTRSDGITTTKSLNRPQVGDSVTIDGTTGSDRVQAWINANNGMKYLVYDQVLAFRPASPG